MSDSGTVPFLDLVTPHRELMDELVSVFRGTLATAGFVGGSVVEEFEKEFAKFSGVRYCVGVGSGTDALRLALIAAGVRRGDTIVTVPNTFIATAEAISQAGARPDFVDVDEQTYNMAPQKLQEYLEIQCRLDGATGRLLNRKTQSPVTGVVPVHLYGQMADMDHILKLAERYKLLVIEDACQAHGASYFSQTERRWRKAGSIGVAGAFSFYPGKNLGACGEAGAVTTSHQEVAETVRMLRDHGQRLKYHHEAEGYNARLDALQAGILHVKLKYLQEWNRQRQANARRYFDLFDLRAESIILPRTSARMMSAYHLFVIRVNNRDQLRAILAENGIATQIHYPTPLHLQKAYRFLGYEEGNFPVAEKVAAEILSLPMYPHLEYDQQKRVVAKVIEAVHDVSLSNHSTLVLSRPQMKDPLSIERC